MQVKLLVLLVSLVFIVAGSASAPSIAGDQSADIPDWLRAHIGEGEGKIAEVVLRRARALHLEKVAGHAVKNPCYFAMDATRPSLLGNGKPARRFYIICESDRSFRAISSGHGVGRNVAKAKFANGRSCAKNFGNAMDSSLMTGGRYVTAEVRTSFKGYHRVSAKKDVPLVRSFVLFDGEGDTANAKERAIGGHAAVVLRVKCRRKMPDSPYADKDGYVRFGRLDNYTGGRSNGCTTWSLADAEQIVPMVEGNPSTVYIYPESTDIDAIAQAVKAKQPLARAGLYWNASCLKEIRSPKFWPKETLEPLLAKPEKDQPPPTSQSSKPPRPLPKC